MSNLRSIPSEHDPDALAATVMALPEILPFIPEPDPPRVTGKSNAPARRPNDDAKHLRLIAEALRRRP